MTSPLDHSRSEVPEFPDLPGALEQVAARARGERAPRFHLDPARIRALAKQERLPVLVLCLSSSLSGLAACVMVFLALHANPQALSIDRSVPDASTALTTPIPPDGAAASPGEATVIANVAPASESSDTDALFSPLYWELP